MNLRLSSRFRWSAALVGFAVFAGQGCRNDDEEPYLFGPDQDGDGWPHELDCNDRDDTIFPSADDVPGDGIDQDCSGEDALLGMGGSPGGNGDGDGDGDRGDGDLGDGDGDMGVGGAPVGGDEDGDGFVDAPDGPDCDGTRREVFPGAIEIALNGIDEDCDGSDLAGVSSSQPILPGDAVAGEAPDLAAGEVNGNHRLLAVWADSRDALRQDVYGQLYKPNGEPVGSEIEIDVTDPEAKSGVRVVSKGDGFLVTWATASGVFAQQLDEKGRPRGIVFGMGDPGAQSPVPAYGGEGTNNGGAWAVAWTRPSDAPGNQAKLRGLSTDTEAVRAPVQNLGGVTDTISGVGLTGHETGFVVTWEGPLGEERGIVAQDASRTAQLRGDSFGIYAGSAAGPAITEVDGEFYSLFRMTGALSVAGARKFALSDEIDPSEAPEQLSAEVLSVGSFRLAATGGGVFAGWADGRHLTHTPAVFSVYGNVWDGESAPKWSLGRALYTDTQVEFGGVAAIGERVFVVVKTGAEVRLVEY